MLNSTSTDLSIDLDDKARRNVIPRNSPSINRDVNAMEFNAVHMLADGEPQEEEESERLLPNNYARTRKEFVAQELYVLESDREDKIRHYSIVGRAHLFHKLFNLRESVLSLSLVAKISFFTLISVLFYVLTALGYKACDWPASFADSQVPQFNIYGHALLGTVFGLLLVYRTNTAYDRYWEARKLICLVCEGSLGLMRTVHTWDPQDLSELSYLLISVLFCLETRLRERTKKRFVSNKLSQRHLQFIRQSNNATYALTVCLSQWIKENCPNINANTAKLGRCEALVSMVEQSQIQMDRMVDTPVPMNYVIHVNQMIFLYLLTLPFCLISLEWFAIPIMFLVSFGMIAAASEIEEPFGYDANDIKFDEICLTVIKTLEFMVQNSL